MLLTKGKCKTNRTVVKRFFEMYFKKEKRRISEHGTTYCSMIQSGAISRRPSGLPPNFDPSPRNSLFMVAAESKTDRKSSYDMIHSAQIW